MSKNLILCVFVVIYKKGDNDECANYRTIYLLNHSYKVLAKCVLSHLVQETIWFISD